jgi:hypothetical protein
LKKTVIRFDRVVNNRGSRKLYLPSSVPERIEGKGSPAASIISFPWRGWITSIPPFISSSLARKGPLEDPLRSIADVESFSPAGRSGAGLMIGANDRALSYALPLQIDQRRLSHVE